MSLFRRPEPQQPLTIGNILESLDFTCGISDLDRLALIQGLGTTGVGVIAQYDATTLAGLMETAGIAIPNPVAVAQKLLTVLERSDAAPQAITSLAQFRKALKPYAGAAVSSSGDTVELTDAIVESVSSTYGSIILSGCIVLGDVTTSRGNITLYGSTVVLGKIETTYGNVNLCWGNFALGDVCSSRGSISTTPLGAFKVYRLSGAKTETGHGQVTCRPVVLPWTEMYRLIQRRVHLPWAK